MTLALYTFGISFVVMISMLYTKLYEIKVGHHIFLSGLRQKSDQFLKKFFRILERSWRMITSWKFWVALTTFLAREFYEHIILHPRVTQTSKKVVDVVKGKKTIKNKGPVSFYLQDVAEYKNNLRTE